MLIRLIGVVGAGIICLIILALLAASCQEMRTRRELRLFSPSGRMVPIDHGVIHLHCVGSGSPAIVITGGVGVLSLQWSRIQRELARDARVCTWDRRGFAW